MKRFILIAILALLAFTFSNCNNQSHTDSHTDSVSNTIAPGNSPVRPNSNSEVIPNGQEGSSGGLDTAMIDSLTQPDSTKNH